VYKLNGQRPDGAAPYLTIFVLKAEPTLAKIFILEELPGIVYLIFDVLIFDRDIAA